MCADDQHVSVESRRVCEQLVGNVARLDDDGFHNLSGRHVRRYEAANSVGNDAAVDGSESDWRDPRRPDWKHVNDWDIRTACSAMSLASYQRASAAAQCSARPENSEKSTQQTIRSQDTIAHLTENRWTDRCWSTPNAITGSNARTCLSDRDRGFFAVPRNIHRRRSKDRHGLPCGSNSNQESAS
jgi:hypothetical protein